MSGPVLETNEISKSFGATKALSSVYFTVMPGETLAVVGENGAGKSTLMRILAGVESADCGSIHYCGRLLPAYDVATALSLGIVLIHQELNLAGNLTVAENIFLGREPRRRGFILTRKMNQAAAEILERIGLKISPRTLVQDLSIAQQQQVEIARALSLDARVIIFDEPTSSLTTQETERLFILIDELRFRGLAIVYISHRLAEVKRIAQRVLVLRDGKNVGFLVGREITHENMIALMVGRDLSVAYPWEARNIGDVVLTVSNFQIATSGEPCSLSVRAGEIVGIGGLVGSGRTELLTTIFGVRSPISGSAAIEGKSILLGSIAAAIEAGVGLVPESRKDAGLILSSPIIENVTLPALKKEGWFWLSRRWEQACGDEMQTLLGIKAASVHQRVSELSGGNQQKVVLGKWLTTRPKVLLLDEPTRGIDVGAKRELYSTLFTLATQGLAVLFVSSEMEELLGIADRIYVMRDSAIAGEILREEFSESRVMELATSAQNGEQRV